ncbi:MAG: hypothetical protein ACYS80_12665 [Planctomycetota bacterium]|jgi:hypothetical protein
MLLHHSITPNKEALKKELAENERQRAEWKHFRHLCSLQRERNTLTRRCLTMYSEEPYDTQELREYAQKILIGYDEVVNELIVQVEKRISEKERWKAERQSKSQK